ncbi:hypothetical protein, partial [uncultured Aeromicrobium sp.]|uniref:hypothetical protein n=1 Tax=uncultured Aeromicrobium sp. TaxID=337820 RepID=UPI0025F7D16C
AFRRAGDPGRQRGLAHAAGDERDLVVDLGRGGGAAGTGPRGTGIFRSGAFCVISSPDKW